MIQTVSFQLFLDGQTRLVDIMVSCSILPHTARTLELTRFAAMQLENTRPLRFRTERNLTRKYQHPIYSNYQQLETMSNEVENCL